MGNFTNKENKKISKLSKLLNAAVIEHGSDHVLKTASNEHKCTTFSDIAEVKSAINNLGTEIGLHQFNWLANTLKDLAPKVTRDKDYSHFSKQPEEITIGTLIEKHTRQEIRHSRIFKKLLQLQHKFSQETAVMDIEKIKYEDDTSYRDGNKIATAWHTQP